MARDSDSGYSFESSDSRQSADWRRRHAGGRPVTLTGEEQKLAAALRDRPPAATPGPRPVPSRPGQKIEAAKPDPDACPGDCNKRYREAWEAYAAEVADYNETGLLDAERSRPDMPDAGFWYGEPVWCAECTAKITLRLAQLDYLAGILAATADGHRTSGDLERVSGSAEPASPSQAGDDLDEMFGMLGSWEEIYRTLKGWSSGPPRGDLASRETECINWLQRHLRGILASDVAADFGREIIQWHRESATSAKAGVRTLRKPMRCPGCKFVTLFWTEGEKDVHCKNPACNVILSLSAYEDEAERQAAALARGEDGQDDAA